MRFDFPFTDRQKQMVQHPARILWIGTATKTGKSAASYCWLVEGLLRGENCAFVGPWFFRARRAFDEIKVLLEPWIRARQVKVNEARLQIQAGSAYLDFLSADNPDCLFGSNFHRLVLDESSRMPEAIHGAALTVISATRGKLRCLFNLELGVRNWSIRNLLRVQRLSEEERARTSEAFMTFPTDPALVDPALVEVLRSQMPIQLFQALYEAKIPDDDTSLFRGLDRIFVGKELEGPEPERQYFMATDLARKQDFSVLTVIDDQGNVVASDRFNAISWSLQCERAALWYKTFNCRKVIVDATGVGDPIAEEFEKLGMNVESFIFTLPSRRALIEELVLAVDNVEISIPATKKFQVYRAELEAMEYQVDGSTIRYAVPGNLHDDCVMSLALATHAFRKSRGAILGCIEWIKRNARDVAEGVRDKWGELVHKPEQPPKPAAPAPTSQPLPQASSRPKEPEYPFCKKCNVMLQPFGNTRAAGDLRCQQCGGTFLRDGTAVSTPDTVIIGVTCCENPLRQTVANIVRCGSCGQQTTTENGGTNGMTFRQYESRRKSPFGRFGSN